MSARCLRQLQLDEGDAETARQSAYQGMLQAAKALIQIYNIDVVDEPAQLVEEFKMRFYDSELFFDPFAGPKFAHYLFQIHAEEPIDTRVATVRRRIEEAQLFIEAAHGCYNRLSSQLQLA